MFGKIKKEKFPIEVKMFEIQWYPNLKACPGKMAKGAKMQQMPPLMVRKAEWRR
jgi:hypothetical protein